MAPVKKKPLTEIEVELASMVSQLATVVYDLARRAREPSLSNQAYYLERKADDLSRGIRR